MKRFSRFVLTVFFTLLLAACSNPEPAGIPPHLREIMETNRAIALPPFPDDFRERADVFLTQGLTREEDLRIANEKLRILFSPGQGFREIRPENRLSDSIPREDAAKDINLLFDLMKYGYAGYRYFGGDEVFIPIRNSMLERLAKMPDTITGMALLRDILVPGLGPVIADNHFQLHNITLWAPRLSARINEEFILRKIDDGFVTTIDNIEYRFIEATFLGQKVDGILPTLTRDGEAAFVFGHFAAWDPLGPQPMSVLLESVKTDEELSLDIRLQPMPNIVSPNRLFHQYEINGIPVIENRHLDSTSLEAEERIRFRKSGESLRGRPVVVLDLRGHKGGFEDAMLAWIDAFTWRRPMFGQFFGEFRLRSMSNDEGRGNGPEWTSLLQSFSSKLPNESFLIVLTDGNVMSAGEILAGLLRQFENVIFVGTNTRGMALTAQIMRDGLPRSGINVIFGTQLNLRPDFSQFEGVGFMPDLWVPPTESLGRVLAFIERYGLAHER
ncbi:MAG: S41 family peptidase [Treponema sp.]|nr:S41 family peptidase [Treponema sp.]